MHRKSRSDARLSVESVIPLVEIPENTRFSILLPSFFRTSERVASLSHSSTRRLVISPAASHARLASLIVYSYRTAIIGELDSLLFSAAVTQKIHIHRQSVKTNCTV